MNITLAQFQLKAIADLLDAMESPGQDIVLKSCTGSGKTIILTHFMDEYSRGNANSVFVWLTPGKGDLEQQSKEKMDRYIHTAHTKLLADVMTSGFEDGDACFINWEKLTKKGNNALKDSEHTNFLEHIEKALDRGLNFTVIVDESHQNDTVKADDILALFKTRKIIRCSATPKGFSNAQLIEIQDADVIAEGLIKKMLVINENFPQNIRVKDQVGFLLERALNKQRKLRAALLERKAEVNPLIIVQIPNKSELLQDQVERWFESRGITYENEQLAVWLANQKENLDEIERLNSTPVAIIIKQAVATGWDCPRAYILVKLRDNMDETFEIQTIGRIRRMPEAKHYETELLDNCYLYTLDDKFTQGVKQYLGKDALEAMELTLKDEYKSIVLTSQQRPNITETQDPQQALWALKSYFCKVYHTDGKTVENQKKLEASGYVFKNEIGSNTRSGRLQTLDSTELGLLNLISIWEPLNTHKHGREYHHTLAQIALKVGLEYSQMNTIVYRLFSRRANYSSRILTLDSRAVYAFVLNNADRLKNDIRLAISQRIQTPIIKIPLTTVPFHFPQTCLFTYDGNAKSQQIREKNVYMNYLSSAEIRSDPEKKFEAFCEKSPNVLWLYKNGDKGSEYLSIIYNDAFGRQKAFFPDYVLGTTSGIWIIETKGGFDRTGGSEDIDIFSPLKFDVLKNYLHTYGLQGGFVREDKRSLELCICTEEYGNDVNSASWRLLREVL